MVCCKKICVLLLLPSALKIDICRHLVPSNDQRSAHTIYTKGLRVRIRGGYSVPSSVTGGPRAREL
uniref:Secreted protein n=1 Tax=Anguilla anguilla TaxID=7936 RepID=A0A0E9UE79_ANGAN